jgi:hypothetical protein
MMKKKNPLVWGIAILVCISAVAFVQRTLANTIYLPLVSDDPTITPSLTPSTTPTPTPTPTITPTPTNTPVYYVEVFEIVNSDTTDPLEEYVTLYNKGTQAEDLTGWFIRDDGPNRYDFPTNFTIPSKEYIRVWTMAGEDTLTDLYWGSEVEVWNDVTECAYLRDDSEGEKILVHKYCYPEDEDSLWRLFFLP